MCEEKKSIHRGHVFLGNSESLLGTRHDNAVPDHRIRLENNFDFQFWKALFVLSICLCLPHKDKLTKILHAEQVCTD